MDGSLPFSRMITDSGTMAVSPRLFGHLQGDGIGTGRRNVEVLHRHPDASREVPIHQVIGGKTVHQGHSLAHIKDQGLALGRIWVPHSPYMPPSGSASMHCQRGQTPHRYFRRVGANQGGNVIHHDFAREVPSRSSQAVMPEAAPLGRVHGNLQHLFRARQHRRRIIHRLLAVKWENTSAPS